MLTVDRNQFIFSFPEVSSEAILRIDFRAEDGVEVVPLVRCREGENYLLARRGRVAVYLHPNRIWEGSFDPRHFPFAVLIEVGGINALTGRASLRELTRPQNYFVTPPQGGIDVYRVGEELRGMSACGDIGEDRLPMDITVMPRKLEGISSRVPWGRRDGWCGAFADWGCHFPLSGEEEVRCEPVYEDICSLGDWDQRRRERVAVWLHGGRGG